MADEFTHLTDSGVHMVEVGGKPDQKRRAIASGKICLDKNTIKLIQNEEIKKGNVLTTAQIAGIQAVKKHFFNNSTLPSFGINWNRTGF